MSKYDFPVDLDKNTSTGKILRYITPNSTVLEFGSANGRMTRFMNDELNCNVYIVEIDPEAYADAIIFAKDGVCGDISDYIWCEKFGGIKFDYIIFADILEHLYNPEQVLEKTQDFLKEDGVVIFSVPNIAHNDILMNLYNNKFQYTSTGLLDETHIRFFAYDSLVPFCEKAGYEIVEEDATTAEPFSTEQNFSVTKEMRFLFSEFTLDRQLYNIYQFVCKLQKKTYVRENSIIKISKISHKVLGIKSNFFFDRGKGFNENDRSLISADKLSDHCFLYYVQLDPTIKSIRFDPVEGKGCIVRNLEIISNNGPQTSINSNSIHIDNFNLFTNTDPQFLINFEGKETLWIKIRADIFPFEDMAWFYLLSKFKDFQDNETEMAAVIEAKGISILDYQDKIEKAQSELDYTAAVIEAKEISILDYQDKIEKAQSELDYYKTLFSDISVAYQNISTSFCWRMTKPLRLVLDRIKISLKSNSFTWTLYRGLKYLKQNGFRATLRKARNKASGAAYPIRVNNIQVLSEEEIEKQKQDIFDINIKFSILVPLYNTPDNFLKEMINSVITQTYGNWELCMADGSDCTNNIEQLCSQYIKKYKNIKYKKLSNNMGIAGNTIEAYKLSSGDYFVLLDHDDFLTPNALYELACCIEEHPNADFIYSDRAIFSDETKKVLAYHLLPGYSPDFMRACNYASHLNAFSKFIIDQVGFIRTGYDGSQDYDFELRVMEKARLVVNIPKVLYYCRACEGSVALNPESKMYAYEAGRIAIEEHIERIGYPGKVDFLPDTYSYRIHYDILNEDKISIIIPNKDHVMDLNRCINSVLEKTDYKKYEIIIVENNSVEEETFKYYQSLEKIDKIKIVYYPQKGFNFSHINNYAVSHVQTPYILFLNNDTEVINSNWLTEMLMFAQRDDVGAVGAKLYYPNETFQHIGLYIGLGGHIASHYDHKKSRYETGYMHRLSMPQNYNAITAACLLIKRVDFMRVDGFDDVNFKIGLNDVDLCLKLRQLGKINVLTPYAELYHYESISRGSDENSESIKRSELECKMFRAKWSNYFKNGDEYLNPEFIY